MSDRGEEIMIIAGEASGDRLGADLVKELALKRPDLKFFGTPGPAMRGAGVESLFDSDGWSIVGIGAVAKAVPQFLRVLSELRRIARQRKPAAVVLIDFPEFNLKLASKLKKDGHRVIYYVSPQVWAWRKYRIRTIRESVDLLLSILPFEKQWYAKQGIEHVEFVGNPVVARTNPTSSKAQIFERYRLVQGKNLVALLPGSRRKEIRRHLPVMIDAAIRMGEQSVQFVVAAATAHARFEIESILGESPGFAASVAEGETIDVLNAADAAVISSGTATLEAAIVGTPMVVVYKLPRTDYLLFQPFVNVPHIALINLVAGRSLVTELIQDEFNAEYLARELNDLLRPERNERMRLELRLAVEVLRSGDSTANAADQVIKFLDGAGAIEERRNSR